MAIQQCIDLSQKLINQGLGFLGFQNKRTPTFEDYALQDGFPVARTYIESHVIYGRDYGKSEEDSIIKLRNDYLFALKIWNRLVEEHGWEEEDFDLFEDLFMEHDGLGKDTYLAYCTSHKYEEYQLIEYANRAWNSINKNKPPKADSLKEERARIELQRFDESTKEEIKKWTDDLHHYTNGADISGMDNKRLKEVFGNKADSIIYITGMMQKDAEHTARWRSDLIEQHAPFLN